MSNIFEFQKRKEGSRRIPLEVSPLVVICFAVWLSAFVFTALLALEATLATAAFGAVCGIPLGIAMAIYVEFEVNKRS